MTSKEIAKHARIDVLKMVSEKKVGFIGSAYSCIDILSVLYNEYFTEGDDVILSKGHAVSAWYSVLAECGMISRTELTTFNDNGSK